MADINGAKEPNKWTHDMHIFRLEGDGNSVLLKSTDVYRKNGAYSTKELMK